MYSAVEVAKYIIWYCKRQGYSISNLKLQKILYFVQASFLVNQGKPCFYEAIEAWDFGPVVPEVYHEFKIFGGGNISGFGCEDAEKAITYLDRQLINDMVDECAAYSASSLVEITHNQDPWKNTYQRGCNNTISISRIKAYFEED
nr:MAG TPA: hypothetical protein [Caudoviricetes sp.]